MESHCQQRMYIWGWLGKNNDPSTMGNDLFAYENKYSNPTAGGTALHSGAISQSFWNTANTDTSLIDFSIPESKVLLAIYLTLPEVDNDRRSMKIREGVRAALLSGRWSRNAPFGYSNTRDKINKPHIVPNEKAHLIKFAFEQVATGVSQEFIRVQLRKRGLIVSRANISRMLRNLVYLGKIRVPFFENEPEMIVEGLHDGIVNDELFYCRLCY